jgi:lysophospholipase L1-like esterase
MDLWWEIILAALGILILFILVKAWQFIRLPYNNPVQYLRGQQRVGITDHLKLVIIGDSITHAHVSADFAQMLRERFAAAHISPAIDVINAGINSELAYNALQRVDQVIICDPDAIAILIGTNDANGAFTPEKQVVHKKRLKLPELPTADTFRTYLTQLVARLTSETRARIALLSIPTINEDPTKPEFTQSVRFSEIIRDVANAAGVTYLPLNETMVADLQANPSHPKYSFDHEILIMYKSIFAHGFGKSWAGVARGNGNRLHTDFLHLSPAGATMVADLIDAFSKNAGLVK